MNSCRGNTPIGTVANPDQLGGRGAQLRGVQLLQRMPGADLRADDGADSLRHILVEDATDEQIVTVDGARWTGRTDRHATVERPAPGAAAALVVRTPIADKFEAGIPPLPFELRREEADALRDSMAERR